MQIAVFKIFSLYFFNIFCWVEKSFSVPKTCFVINISNCKFLLTQNWLGNFFRIIRIKIIRIYIKIIVYENLELIFYITGSSICWGISSYELFIRTLNIIGVKLKWREDIFQVKSIFNRTLSRTHFQNITRYLGYV